jgi:Rrf2 family transcriptional regulator, nitric oxide-sensitive transcriptional repressor
MRLNRSTSHALRILIDCARAEGALVKVGDISQRLDLSTQNAFKIVHLLSRAGLIAATRGRYGGVALARSADRIRIGDVVRAMETTEIELDIQGASGAGEPASTAGVNRVLDDALEAFIAVLDQHTLADMAAARTPEQKPPTVAKRSQTRKAGQVALAAQARASMRPRPAARRKS